MSALRERGPALDLLAAELSRATEGTGRLVLIRGATGTGRTALLDAVADDARARGTRVLRARCATEDQDTPLATIRQLLAHDRDAHRPRTPARSTAGGRREAEHAEGPQAEGQPAGGERPPAEAGDAEGERTEGCRAPCGTGDDAERERWERLLPAPGAGPLLITVDDVHLADHASRRWLARTARRLDHTPVLLVVTERRQYDVRPSAPGLAHALPPSLVRSLTLSPLSAVAAAGMVRETLGSALTHHEVDACARAGARNPLLLRALLDDLRVMDTTALPGSCAELYPGGYLAAVAWWLECAGEDTTLVARALAALAPGRAPAREEEAGDRAPHPTAHLDGLLGEVTGTDPERATAWSTAMLRLGVLRTRPGPGPLDFAHPLLREAVLDGWPHPQREAVHRAAAEVGHRRGAAREAVAHHLLRTPALGAAWAAEALVDAAREELADGGRERAALLLGRALDEPLSRHDRAAVLTELGSLEFSTAGSGGIPRLTEALRLQARPRDKAEAAVTLATALAHRGQTHIAFGLLRDLAGRLSAEPLLARGTHLALLLLSEHDREVRRFAYAGLRGAAGQPQRALGAAEQALVVRFEAGAALVSASRASNRVRALLAGPAGHPAPTGPEDPALEPYLLVTAASVLQWADHPDEAERLALRGLERLRVAPSTLLERSLDNTLADILAARGRPTDVLAFLDARGLPGERPGHTGPSDFHAHALTALVGSGRVEEARRLAEDISVDGAHDSWELNRYLYARGQLRLAGGDPAGALDDFLECGRRQTSRDVLSPAVTPWRSAASRCQLLLSRPHAALELAREEHRLAEIWGTPRVLGRALRALGEATGGRHGLDLTGEAVHVLRETSGTGLEAELVHALLAHGRLLRASGRRTHARPPLREAAEIAEHLDARHLVEAVGRALRDSGARPRELGHTGPSSLTGSEARIAGLAAAGNTNSQIADLLHLALRTVETHLTSVYRKLGIHGRSALPEALGPADRARGGTRGPRGAAKG